MVLSPGIKLGPYEVRDHLGRGGMGEVYSAEDTRLGRLVAIKVLPEELAADARRRRNLVREARSAASLSHPNVCTLYEVSDYDGRPFIAMEHIPGRTIADLLKSDGLQSEEVLRYGGQIADALAYAHDHGVIHRDLKAANVMVTPEGRIKVVDFGLAKRLEQDDLDGLTQSNESITVHGAVAGTLAYMAPEVLAGKSADERCDIWALGVLLYTMVTRQLPFRGGTAFELTAAILRESPAPLPPSVLPSLRSIVDHCLAKKRSQRYQRAGEIRAALESAHEDLKVAEPSGAAPPPDPDQTTLELGSPIPADSASAIGAPTPTSSVEIQALNRIAGALAPIVLGAKIVAGMVVGLAVLGFLGLVTSATFDLALQLPHTQTIFDYVVFGLRAMIPVVGLMAFELGLALAVVGSVRLILWATARIRRRPPAPLRLVARARERFDAMNRSTVIAMLLLLAVATFAAVSAVSLPALGTIEDLVERPTEERIATVTLSPSSYGRHFLVSWVAATAFLVAGAAWILGIPSLKRGGLEGAPLALLRTAGVIALLAAAAFAAAPWRLVFNSERELASYDGARAYVVGESDDSVFLYMPDGSQRTLEIGTQDPRLVRTSGATRESIFTQDPTDGSAGAGALDN